MGKWTPNYTDNVLHTKISALITGAINRAAVEKEPTITYDDFVHELDTGDAFTTSVIDILVKELAERHTRPCQHDERKLIAPRTMERLRSLANPRQVYQAESPGNRNHARRRTINLSDFMNAPSGELDMDDEDDYGSFLDPSSNAAEGARFNTDLFEAYGSHSWAPFARRVGTTPSPPLEDDTPVWRPLGALSNTGRGSTWAAIPTSNNSSSTTLTRHPSIRRPARSRMGDFHDWTSRRRSSIRDAVGAQAEGSDSNTSSLTQSAGGEPSQNVVRRFFPTFGRRLERRPDSWEDRSDDGATVRLGVTLTDRNPSLTQNLAQAGFQSTEPQTFSGVGTGETDDRPLPRLRRGGVRPPEMLWTQHRYSWPSPNSGARSANPSPEASANTGAQRSPPPAPEDLRPSSPQRENDTGPSFAEPVGYPTPSSVDNEPTST